MPLLPKRIFISSGFPAANCDGKGNSQRAVFSKTETHYLRNVLRLKEGTVCRLFDRFGNEFVSRLGSLGANKRLEAVLLEPIRQRIESALMLTVAQAIPQHGKFDHIVEKASEIGLERLIPLLTERTNVHFAAGREEKVNVRWERILFQTAQQSQVEKIPEIAAVTNFKNLCACFSEFDETYLLHPEPSAKPIRSVKRLKNDSVKILLVVGPEGGFSEAEVKKASASGAAILKMGRAILKTDTAFVAASSFFKFIYE